jgi:hypothetical protein
MKQILMQKRMWFGVIAGALAGYAYYYFVGCASGTCAITSNPINSTAYGAIMGGLFFVTFEKEKQQKNSSLNNQNNE